MEAPDALDAAGGATLQRKGQQIIKKSNRISARSKSIQSKSSKSSRSSNLAAKKVCTPLVEALRQSHERLFRGIQGVTEIFFSQK